MTLRLSPARLVLRTLVLAAVPVCFAQAQVIDPTLLQTAQVSSVLVPPEGGLLVVTDASFVDGEDVGSNISVRRFSDNGEIDLSWRLPQYTRAVARDPQDGSIIVAGMFSTVNGPNGAVPRQRIARLSASGQLQPWSLQPDEGQLPLSNVERLLFMGNGDLMFIDGAGGTQSRLCVVAASESVYRCVHEITGEVRVLKAMADGSVLMGGSMVRLGDAPVPSLLRLLPGSLARDEAFSYSDTSAITAVEIQNGTVWVGAGARLRRLMSDGSIDPSLSIDANGTLWSLRADGIDGLFVGGSFSTIGGVDASRLARLRTTATPVIDTLWRSPAIVGDVRDIAVLPDRVLAAGGLHSIAAQAAGLISLGRANGAAVEANRPPRLGKSANSPSLVSAPLPDGGALFAGDFTQSRDEVLPGLLKVDSSGAPVAEWAPELPGHVMAMVSGRDGFVYVGLVRHVSAFVQEYTLRRLSLVDGSLDHGWQLPLNDGVPSALTIDSGTLWYGVKPGGSNSFISYVRRVGLGTTAVPDFRWNISSGFTGTIGRIIPLPDGSALVPRGPVSSSGVIFFPPPPSPPGPRMYRFSPGEFGIEVLPFGPDFTGFFSDIARQADGRILALELSGSTGAILRRLSASGELDADFDLPMVNPLATGSIALDEARGFLYYGASMPDPDWPSRILHRQARLVLSSQTVDHGWPNEGEDPGVRSTLTLRGQQVFVGAMFASLYQPIGAFMKTSAPPLFVNGFEPH